MGYWKDVLAKIATEVDNAFDTAIPGSPTAGSVNDVLKDLDGVLPASGTLATVSDLSSGFTDKEKSLLGLGVHPGYRFFFNDVADGADPNTSEWDVLETGGAAVTVENDDSNVPSRVVCDSGATTNDSAAIRTINHVSLKNGTTECHLKARIYLDAPNGEDYGTLWGLCPAAYAFASTASFFPNGACIHNGYSGGRTWYFRIYDGVNDDDIVITSYFTESTWMDVEIVINDSGVATLYIDGTQRAQSSTATISANWKGYIGSKGRNSKAGIAKCQFMELWGE